jgi:hypothetical protein
MRGQFNGKVGANVDLDESQDESRDQSRPFLLIDGKSISLQAVAAVSPVWRSPKRMARSTASSGTARASG